MELKSGLNKKLVETKIELNGAIPKKRCFVKSDKYKGQSENTVSKKQKPGTFKMESKPNKTMEVKKHGASETIDDPTEQSSDSSKKGVVLPSLKEVLAYREKCNREKLIIDKLDEILNEDNFNKTPPIIGVEVDSSSDDELQNCEHISEEDLEMYCKKNMKRMKSIYEGVIPFPRHDHYFNNPAKRSQLIINNSMILFTVKQKLKLLQWLSEEFAGHDDMDEYFMMVLLPEMCFCIFQDVYNMTREQATLYLK